MNRKPTVLNLDDESNRIDSTQVLGISTMLEASWKELPRRRKTAKAVVN
jgi:hypothetical protein